MKVFLSSTGRDLADYRQAAIEMCNRLQLVPLAMEFFEAMGKGASAGSLAKLAEADVYVGIFAHRYGYIEPGSERSVTEAEFDTASERGLEQICFLVDPNHPWPPDAWDAEHYAQLKRFKSRVEQSRIRAQFTTVDDFKMKLLHALSEWKSRHGDERKSIRPEAGAPVWYVPVRRTDFFTGREATLEELHRRITAQGRVALNGLGGIGKTQIALEYAHRYRDAYVATSWINAATESTIAAGCAELANLLDLPERAAPDERRVVAAVTRWLETHERWLLIADNADDPVRLRPLLPHVLIGHLLVTSRAQVFDMLGITKPLEVRELPHEEAVQFLLTRAGRDSDTNPQELAAAQTLAHELGHLPLALEQAAAYILSNRSRFAAYLAGYRARRLKVLERGVPVDDPTKSVTTTWQIAFDRIAGTPASADLLRASAFLSADRIPLELVTEGAAELGPAIGQVLPDVEDELALDELLAPLSRYSLIRREPESRSYDLHRLVQEVTRDAMDSETRRIWAERVVAALNGAFPEVEYTTWTQCERLLAHAQVAAQLVVEHDLFSGAAARLLNQTAYYLAERAQYAEAEPLYQRSLTIRERLFGPEHPDVAQSLNNLAWLYRQQAQYAAAEPLYGRSLMIRERVFGPEHPNVAESLNNLALLYQQQGRYAEAEPLYQRSLTIREQVLGPEHPDVARSLTHLAELHFQQGRFAEAGPLFQRSLTILERVLGPDHP